MKKNVFIAKVFTCLTVAASAMALLSCSDNLFESDDNNLPQSSHFFVFGSTADSTTTTRVAYVDENYTKSTFEDGNVVRVYQLSGGAGSSVVKSARYKVANNTSDNTKYLTPESDNDKISQHNGTTYAFVYPDPGANTDITKLSHNVKDNQNSKDNFEASDLLWDVVTASNDKATIEMDHAMAQIILEADEKVAGESATITLSGSPAVSISGLNLTYGKENDAWSTSASATENNGSTTVTMWNYGYNSDQNRIFRAVVPAQTMKAAKFLTIAGGKSYKLEEDLAVSGGNNYILHINKNSTNPDQPEINDDDSWVLDVLDPETGEPVGLLCREYLRYQQNDQKDENTGTSTNNGSKQSKWINSQAWVFYNLKDYESRIPELNKGTVLRFIYDFEEEENSYLWWPCSEGQNYRQHGIFSPVHGAKWCSPFNNYKDSYEGGHEVYENGKPKITEYYMHGGIVNWNGKKNKIESFDMPTEKITCEQAEKFGHIAIDEKNGKINVYVSYKEDDGDGIKKGVIVPHNLVDKRKVGNTIEINKYPLVKIGYNQFWMSKSLRAKTLTDGTELTCYNKKGEPGVTFDNNDNKENSLGYMYPYAQDVDNGNNSKANYDPYNISNQMQGYDNYIPLPVYNMPCMENKNFLPNASDSRLIYIMPSKSDIETTVKYMAVNFGGKVTPRYISKKNDTGGNDTWVYSYLESMIRGEQRIVSSTTANCYTANVSGFNWRAIGYYDPWNSYNSITGTHKLLLKPTHTKGVASVTLSVWTYFGGTAYTFEDEEYAEWRKPSKQFAQVRFVMKFKNQADTGGSSNAAATRATSTSAAAKSSSNNVYVQLIEK